MSIYDSIIRTTAWCATCRDDSTFEQPECVDGHGIECPEWVCVRCAEAVMIGFELADPRAAGAVRVSHVA
jgi:hypothetical protein